jgi:hypothetical protein
MLLVDVVAVSLRADAAAVAPSQARPGFGIAGGAGAAT